MCNEPGIQIGQLPETFQNDAFRALKVYSTGMALCDEAANGPTGPSSFAAAVLKDMASLVERLTRPADPVSVFLSQHLSAATRNALTNYRPASQRSRDLQASLSEDLNVVIRGPSIYAETRFHGVRIRFETRSLLERNPHGQELLRLNRLLLEDAFPTHILRDFYFIGSATFIRWRDHFGLLTATHVIRNSPTWELDASAGSTQQLRLFLGDRANAFSIPVRGLQTYCLPGSREEHYGPDLSVIHLPPGDLLGTLKASKSFYNLSFNTADKLAKAQNETGCLVVSGFPAEAMQDVRTWQGFEEVALAEGLIGLTGQEGCFERVYDDGEHPVSYDYLEFMSIRDKTNNAPTNYGGVSGGSLWRVPFYRRPHDDNSKIFFRDATLAGVPIYQEFEPTGSIRVRCHGPKSIYESMLAVLP